MTAKDRGSGSKACSYTKASKILYLFSMCNSR